MLQYYSTQPWQSTDFLPWLLKYLKDSFTACFMVKERERKKQRQGHSEDVTAGVTQPQFPLSTQCLGYLSSTVISLL